MQVFIVKDGGATKIPKEVADQAAVDALRAAGWEVEVPEEAAGEEAPAAETAAAEAPKAKAKKAKA